MVKWIVAYERFALVAHVNGVSVVDTCIIRLCGRAHCCQMWHYHAAKAHLDICCEIAGQATLADRGHFLGQVYDEVCRKVWHEQAIRGMAVCLIFLCVA